MKKFLLLHKEQIVRYFPSDTPALSQHCIFNYKFITVSVRNTIMHMHSVIMILMFIDFYYQIACRTDIGYIISFFLDDWCLMKVAEKIFKFFHLFLKFQLIFSNYAWHQNLMLHVYSMLDIIIHPARDFDNKFSTSVRKNHFGTKKNYL